MVKKITCKGGKENHTKINVLLMQAEVVRACKAKFDEQLCRVYTRAVYQEYKKEYNTSTTFVIRPDPNP
jgi:hypothetical protein